MPIRIVILAAGLGSRLGSGLPKPLTQLQSGESILGRQLQLLADEFGAKSISIVVGYKKEHIMETFPEYGYIYNEDYSATNTSKSLLKALCHTGPESVLWLNGDVVFGEILTTLLATKISENRSFVCVNTSHVDDEEVKYATVDGLIRELSKDVDGAEGEAIGINFVNAADKHAFILRLEECVPDDYFERAIEVTIRKDGTRFDAFDIPSQLAIEVDSISDLEQANREFG